MSRLYNSTRPALVVPQSPPWVQNDTMSADEPPAKRPCPQLQAMSAWSPNSLMNLIHLNDNATVNEIRQELAAAGFGWHLHEQLLVPVCKDEMDCTICDQYLVHVLERFYQGDDEPPPTSVCMDVEPTEDGDENGKPKESRWMKMLLHLRSVLCRMDAFSYDHNNDQGKGELKGMMVTIYNDKVNAQRQRDHALTSRAYLEAEIAQLKQLLNQSKADQQVLLEENLVLKGELDVQRQHTLTTQAVLEAENSRWKQSHEEVATQQRLALEQFSAFKVQADSRYDLAVTAQTALESEIVQLKHSHEQETATLQQQLSSCEWRMLQTMTMPSKDDPPRVFARWMQFHELQNIKGIPMNPPDWVVDCRDIRGYHQVTCRIPPKEAKQNQTLRHHRTLCLFAILNVLAIPGKYARLLASTHSRVAATAQLAPLPIRIGAQQPDDEEIARLLAAQGLTVPVADDTWQFCNNFLIAQANDHSSASPRNTASELLFFVRATLPPGSTPPNGLYTPSQDRMERHNVPDKRKVPKRRERIGNDGKLDQNDTLAADERTETSAREGAHSHIIE
ncbi:hypothetical protein C8R47DRAFT_1069255 [Mycena vitilis]|nr:hypothetical protein C8R47DRAFT_1069255 [Mycena vitilis]